MPIKLTAPRREGTEETEGDVTCAGGRVEVEPMLSEAHVAVSDTPSPRPKACPFPTDLSPWREDENDPEVPSPIISAVTRTRGEPAGPFAKACSSVFTEVRGGERGEVFCPLDSPLSFGAIGAAVLEAVVRVVGKPNGDFVLISRLGLALTGVGVCIMLAQAPLRTFFVAFADDSCTALLVFGTDIDVAPSARLEVFERAALDEAQGMFLDGAVGTPLPELPTGLPDAAASASLKVAAAIAAPVGLPLLPHTECT